MFKFGFREKILYTSLATSPSIQFHFLDWLQLWKLYTKSSFVYIIQKFQQHIMLLKLINHWHRFQSISVFYLVFYGKALKALENTKPPRCTWFWSAFAWVYRQQHRFARELTSCQYLILTFYSKYVECIIIVLSSS